MYSRFLTAILLLISLLPLTVGAYNNPNAPIPKAPTHPVSPDIDMSLIGDMNRQGNCMGEAIAKSSVNAVKLTCEACHVSQGNPIAGVKEQCRQVASSWCLKRVQDEFCPAGCTAVEPKCKEAGAGRNAGNKGGGQAPAVERVVKPTPAAGKQNNQSATKPATGATPQQATSNQGKQSATQTQTAPSGNQSADQQKCDQLARRASQCCNNPASCMTGSAAQTGPAPGQGLNEYCQQMKAMGQQSGTSNNSASSTCYEAYSSCVTSCEGMAAGYSGQAAQLMTSAAQSCRSHESKVTQLATQGLTSQVSSADGDICKNVSSSAPQSAGGAGAPAGGGSAADQANAQAAAAGNDPYSQPCSADPNSAACKALNYEKEVRGEASFGVTDTTAKNKKGDFDIQEPRVDASGLNSDPNGFQPTGVKNGTIANNSGGGIPGGEGGAPAKLGDRGGGKGSPGAPGYTTDVLQGFSGAGGYSAPAGGDASADDGGGGFTGYGQGTRAPATDQHGVDLRRFLPGADRDPNRTRTGGIDIYSAQINGKFVNIWNRISERMQEKCRLGELIGCER